MIWNKIPILDGTPADQVLGQVDFDHKDGSNMADGTNLSDLQLSLLLKVDQLYVSDRADNTGLSRILMYQGQ
jgi:hypothetical protein